MRANECDARAGPGSGNGLIGTLATGKPGELAPEQRLAGLGEPVALNDEVGVTAADDDEAGVFGRSRRARDSPPYHRAGRSRSRV